MKLVGSVRRFRHWECVYSRRRPRNVLHDNFVADLIIVIQPAQFTCVDVDAAIEADAELWLPRHWYLELQRKGSATIKQLEADGGRFEKYEAVDDPVLWVIQADTPEEEEAYRDALRARSGRMRNPRFATYTDLIHRTEEAVVLDRDGNPSGLFEN